MHENQTTSPLVLNSSGRENKPFGCFREYLIIPPISTSTSDVFSNTPPCFKWVGTNSCVCHICVALCAVSEWFLLVKHLTRTPASPPDAAVVSKQMVRESRQSDFPLSDLSSRAAAACTPVRSAGERKRQRREQKNLRESNP